jgi:hypothetical protein
VTVSATGESIKRPVFTPEFVQKTLASRKQLVQAALGAVKELDIPRSQYANLFGDEQRGLLNLHHILYGRVLSNVSAGNIVLNPEYNVQVKNTTLYYGKESSFAERREHINYTTRQYSYMTYQKVGDSNLAGGVWITSSNARPQMLWIAVPTSNKKLANPYSNDWSHWNSSEKWHGIAEIYDIANKCTNVTQVQTFFDDLKKLGSANSAVTEVARLRAEYQKLKSVINLEEARKIPGTAEILK